MNELVNSKSNNLTTEIEKYGSDGMSKILESTKCIGLTYLLKQIRFLKR